MRKKIVTLIMMSVLTMGLVACGKESDNSNADVGNSNVNVESNTQENNTDVSTTEPTADAETQDAEADKEPVISAVKEEDAVVDFDGIKIPMTITWEEFKQVMADNNWTFEDDEDDFPCEKHPLHGKGFINTNCGKVSFNFQKNADETEAVLMAITAYKAYCPATISISGINAETSVDTLKEILTPIEDSDVGFYLDDYLKVYVSDTQLSISRTFFHMR